jgi:hypothetical protein
MDLLRACPAPALGAGTGRAISIRMFAGAP